MNPQRDSLENIQVRLLKLENQNLRLKQLGAAALIVAASLIAMGQASSRKTIEANEFILRDDSGNVRARLAVNPKRSHGAPEMFFFDEKGNSRLQLDGGPGLVTDGGGTVTVYDGKGQPRGLFVATVSNGAIVSIFDPDGVAQAFMARGMVTVSDDKGFSATLGSEELATPRTGETHQTSAASLVLFDKNKSVIWKAP